MCPKLWQQLCKWAQKCQKLLCTLPLSFLLVNSRTAHMLTIIQAHYMYDTCRDRGWFAGKPGFIWGGLSWYDTMTWCSLVWHGLVWKLEPGGGMQANLPYLGRLACVSLHSGQMHRLLAHHSWVIPYPGRFECRAQLNLISLNWTTANQCLG